MLTTLPYGKQIGTRGDQRLLRYWHGQPNTYEQNPHGGPLYRVVWSESRQWLLGGLWPNGAIEYRWSAYYGNKKSWMLERWLAPNEWAGSEKKWYQETLDSSLAEHGITVYSMGPYPTRGWYEHVYTFPSDSPPNLELIVPALEATKNLGLAKIKAGLALYHERMKKDWENKVLAGMEDAQAAFHNAPSNVNPAKVTADDVSLERPEEFRRELAKKKGLPAQEERPTPEELNLPKRGFSIRQKR